MKGLLSYDFQLLAASRRTFLIYALLFVVYLVAGMGLPMAIILSLLMVMMGVRISFLAYENDPKFLFTLPFTRRQFVAEKFVLAVILLAVSLGLSSLCFGWGMSIADVLKVDLISFMACLVFGALTICMEAAFGQKGSMMMGVVAAVGVSAFLVISGDFNGEMGRFMEFFSNLWVVAGVSAVLVIVLYFITVSVMEKKRF